MSFTKKEIARLVRKARSFGHFGIYQGERDTWAFVCPVHREAMDAIRDPRGAHQFPVHHLPWEHSPTVAMVTKSLVSHLEDAEINGESCSDLSKAPRS